jgi:capsular exopolysaccharide synthesis family protein
VLHGHVALSTAIRRTFIDDLFFLPAGRYTANIADLFGSDRMSALLQDISPNFDRIVLDTPPVLSVADATVLSGLVDCVLIVVRAGGTDRKAVQQALQQLSNAGGHVVGAVLNDTHGEAHRNGDYYYPGEYAAVGE